MRQVDLGFFGTLSAALSLFTAITALPCAALITLCLIYLFRYRVARSMRATGDAPTVLVPDQRPTDELLRPTELKLNQVAEDTAAGVSAPPLLVEARSCARRQAWSYAIAAGVYAIAVAAALAGMARMSPTHNAVLAYLLLYGLLLLASGTPVIFASAITLGRRPSRLAGAASVLVIALFTVDWVVGTNICKIWLYTAAVPTGVVVLLNTRGLRAVGPIVFVALVLCIYGVAFGFISASFYAAEAVGPIRIGQEDLAQLSLTDAIERYSSGLSGLPMRNLIEAAPGLLANRSSVVRFDHPEALTSGVLIRCLGVWLAATAVGVAAAVVFILWLARAYRYQRASDQMLATDVLILTFTVWGFLVLAATSWLTASGTLIGFLGYKMFVRWQLKRLKYRSGWRSGRTLLLLRVFGFDRRSHRLLDDVGRYWRYLGPIRLLGGADLAFSTINPREFLEFLNGRLTRSFINGQEDLEKRLKERVAMPDPDGRYRVEDFYCYEDTWQLAISSLARKADAVLMDLRGFRETNQGCIYEIQQLVAWVKLEKVVILSDRRTDLLLLEQVIQQAWRVLPGGSPNIACECSQLRILEVSANRRKTLDVLLGLLCEPGFAPGT
jgi:hypothetical protein